MTVDCLSVCLSVHHIHSHHLLLFVLQEFLDNVMKMATSQLPPGAMDSVSGMNGDDGDNMPTVEVKVHMMSVPMMMPPGSMPPFAPQPPPAARNYDSNTDKASKPSKARFPGIFFKKKDQQDSKSATSKDGDGEDDEEEGTNRNKKDKITAKGSDKLSSKAQSYSNLSSNSSSDEKPKRVSESEAAKDLESLSGFFPELLITPPRDHTLKVLWDRMGDAEMGKRVSRLNRRLLEKEILRTKTQLRHLPKRSSQGKYSVRLSVCLSVV